MALNDAIRIAGIQARGTHGVLAAEHHEPQDFLVDLDILLDTEVAARTDNIADTINYATIVESVVAVIEGEHCDLIETLAQRVADAVMNARMVSVEVTVHKPQAPIPHPCADVSVTITREGPLFRDADYKYVISVGSNLDNPEEQVRSAIAELSDFGEWVDDVSSLYLSAPVLAPGQAKQANYINAVLFINSTTPPMAMLNLLQMIEESHGRKRDERWGARTLDLDIIDVSGVTSDNPVLTLPHPRAHERRFVLEPWLEIDPDAQLAGVPVTRLLLDISGQRVRKVGFGDGNP